MPRQHSTRTCSIYNFVHQWSRNVEDSTTAFKISNPVKQQISTTSAPSETVSTLASESKYLCTEQSNVSLKHRPNTTMPHAIAGTIESASVTPVDDHVDRRPQIVRVMPRPRQPGALCFDGKGVSEFLRRWDNECDDFGYDDKRKCRRLPDYCSPEVELTIKLMDEHLQEDWVVLQRELKDLFWQKDVHKFTTAALNKLVQEASNTDLSVFILQFSAISAVLVKKRKLSAVERVCGLIDRLPEPLHEKAMRFCVKKGWKLVEEVDDDVQSLPDYDEVKEFLITEARLSQTLMAYGEHHEAKPLTNDVHSDEDSFEQTPS